MNLHLIVDYSFLYYKYKFQLESGKMRRLTQVMPWNGVMIEKDISQIYYSIREIESFRKEWENQGHTVTISVCFDMPSDRKNAGTEESAQYKSNRVKRLNEDDFANIQFVEQLLGRAGYNTYRFDTFEADDLITNLVNLYSSRFDYSIIYTPDADLLVNIRENVGAKRYKSGKGYSAVTIDNFSEYLSAEMKCYIPYNAIDLYKVTVGDKSDCIPGIKGFGPSAFNKLVEYLTTSGIQWNLCSNQDYLNNVVQACKGYLNENQFNQAVNCLGMVAPKIAPEGMLVFPSSKSDASKRAEAYLPYNMKSLV